MEIDISKLIVSEEQSHSFAILMVNEIKSYIKEHTEEFITWLIEDISANVIMTLDGIITRSSSYEYSLCKYN